MASSRYESVPTIVEYLRSVNPNYVLDVGVGFGKIGLLIREYLEAWNDKVTPDDWEIILHGIEIFPDYHKNSIQDIIYNKIFYGNAFSLINNIPLNYDLITCIDMIEHLDKNDGRILLSKYKMLAKNVLVSIPLGIKWLRKAYGNNKYEAHISYWEEQEINELNYKTINKYKITDGREMGIFEYGK